MMFPSPTASTPFQKEPAQKGTISQHIRGLGLQSGDTLLNAVNTQGRQDVGFRLRLFFLFILRAFENQQHLLSIFMDYPFPNNRSSWPEGRCN